MNSNIYYLSLQEQIDRLESKLFDESHLVEIGQMYQDVTGLIKNNLSSIEDLTLQEIKDLIKETLQSISDTDNNVLMGNLPSYKGSTNG